MSNFNIAAAASTLTTNISFYGATNQLSHSPHEIIYDYNFNDLRTKIAYRKTKRKH